MPKIRLPDGNATDLPEGEPVGSVLPPDAIAARVDGELVDLSFVPNADGEAEPVLPADADGLHVLRHSAAHVMAQAVCDLFPGAKYAIGPPVEDGFYYDLELPGHDLGDRPAEDRGPDARDRGRRSAVRPRGALARRTRSSASPTSRTSARSWRPSRRARSPAATPSPCTGTTAGRTCASGRTCRRPAGSARSSSRSSRARTGAATSPARCSPASTGPRGRPRTISTRTCSGSRRPRSATTGSWARSWSCSTWTRRRRACRTGCRGGSAS